MSDPIAQTAIADAPPQMDAVESSNVVLLGYRDTPPELWVVFKSNSDVFYVYSQVPAGVFADLMIDKSKGSFLSKNVIKHQPPYPFRKVPRS